MQDAVELNDDDGMEDVPVSALLSRRRAGRYGRVPGLDDSELADPAELERQVLWQEWGPVLALPVKGGGGVIRAVADESGGLDWGAFGTVDFERCSGGFDKLRYKAQKLREQLKELVIRIGIVSERLPGKAKYLVWKHLRMGIIELGHIADADMVMLARLWLRAKRLRDEIWQLEEAGKARMRRRLEALWGQ